MYLEQTIIPGNLLRAAFICAAKKDHRKFLEGIYVTDDRIISSDGFMLFHAKYDEYVPPINPEEFGEWSTMPKKGRIIRLMRKPNGKTSTAVLDQIDDNYGVIRYLDWKNNEIDRDVFFLVDEDYPDVSGILTCETVATEQVTLNPDMVAKIDNVFDYANGGGNYGHVTFNLKGEDKAPFFTQEIPGYGELIYLSMPIIIRNNFHEDEEEAAEEVQEELGGD